MRFESLILGVGFLIGLGVIGTCAGIILERNYLKIPAGLRIDGLAGYLLLPIPFVPIYWLAFQK